MVSQFNQHCDSRSFWSNAWETLGFVGRSDHQRTPEDGNCISLDFWTIQNAQSFSRQAKMQHSKRVKEENQEGFLFSTKAFNSSWSRPSQNSVGHLQWSLAFVWKLPIRQSWCKITCMQSHANHHWLWVWSQHSVQDESCLKQLES